jgi:hypothetical protein
MVRPQVISGPASPGQQVWIGSLPRSTSLPSHTISWQGGALTVLGAMSQTAFASDTSLPASLSPLGGSGSLSAESRRPTSRNDSSAAPSPSPACASIPMPSATRRGVPNRLPRTGNACSFLLSNSKAGPPARSTRSHTSVISRTGETFCEIRRSSPIVSRRPTKSRRSLYFIWCGSVPGKRQKGEGAQISRRQNDCRFYLRWLAHVDRLNGLHRTT